MHILGALEHNCGIFWRKLSTVHKEAPGMLVGTSGDQVTYNRKLSNHETGGTHQIAGYHQINIVIRWEQQSSAQWNGKFEVVWAVQRLQLIFTNRWPRSSCYLPLMHYHLSFSSCLWPGGRISIASWWKRNHTWPGSWMGNSMCLCEAKIDCRRSIPQHSGWQWKSGEGKSSLWAKLQAIHLIINFSWRELWPEMRVYIDFWDAEYGLAIFSGTLKEQD